MAVEKQSSAGFGTTVIPNEHQISGLDGRDNDFVRVACLTKLYWMRSMNDSTP